MFSNYLKTARLKANMPEQRQLVDFTLISKSSISKYENGVSIPTVPNLIRLAHALNINYEDIIEAAGGLKKLKWEGEPINRNDQKLDEEIKVLIYDILQDFFINNNIKIKNAFIEIVKKNVGAVTRILVIDKIEDRVSWIKHLQKYNNPDNKEFNHNSNKYSIDRITIYLLHEFYSLYNSTSRALFKIDLENLINNKDIILNTKEIELTETKYILTLDGTAISEKELERIIYMTRFERTH